MKKCEKCGRTYPDDLYYCSECGMALKDVKPVKGADTGSGTSNVSDNMNNIGAQVKSTVEEAQNSVETYFSEQGNYRNEAEKIYKQHGGLILGILGIIFGWSINGLIGFIMALYGFYLCKFEKSQTLRWIALACCGIALLFGILAFLILL